MEKCKNKIEMVRSVNGMTGDVVIEQLGITKEYIAQKDAETLQKANDYTDNELTNYNPTDNFKTINGQSIIGTDDILIKYYAGKGVEITDENIINVTLDTNIFIVVDVLPTTGIENKIYLVPSKDAEQGNIYNEFIWKNGKWEKIGQDKIDLSNYYTKDEIDPKIKALSDKDASQDTAINTNKINITKNTQSISGLQTQIDNAKASITINTNDIAKNKTAIQTNTTNINKNTQSISSLQSQLNTTNANVTKVDKKADNINTLLVNTIQTQKAKDDTQDIQISGKQPKINDWLGTDTEYEAIETKDDNTVYYVKETEGKKLSDYYLNFTAKANGYISLNNRIAYINRLEYSYDCKKWVEVIDTNTNIYVNEGETVYLRGNNPDGVNNSTTDYMSINCSSLMIMSGNIMSLIYPFEELNTNIIPNAYCFFRFFAENANLDIDDNFAMEADTLQRACYYAMFRNNKSLTKAPKLPAKTLISTCYYGMFEGCSAMESIELPATTLAANCYYIMLYGCSNLKYIKVGATSWNTTWTTNWVSRVSSTGTFIKPFGTDIPTGVNGIPNGWTVENSIDDYTLRFTAQANGNISFNNRIANIQKLEYSYNFVNWVEITELNTNVPLLAGQTLYVRGDNPNGISTSNSDFLIINCSSLMIMSGNIMSLIYPTEAQNTKAIPNAYCFYKLFFENTNIDIDDNFVMDATTLKLACYYYMFYGCKSLTKTPDLPATNIINTCYASMFYGCEELVKAMDVLPAINVVGFCYNSMFRGCIKLEKAPVIMLNSLQQGSLSNMFYGCRSLNYVKVGAASWDESYSNNWLINVSATGTFVKPIELNIGVGNSAIPSGWKVINE